MKTRFVLLLTAFIGCVLPLLAQRRPAFLFPSDSTAVIVVTALRLAENDPAGEHIDTSVAEGATVKVTSGRGEAQTKTTTAFHSKGRKSAGEFLTADFSVKLDETYEIVMTFKDGTVIRMTDYRLPTEWKTHFYFHSTNGTKSPASILRTEEDAKTKLQCRVYAVFPYESYQALGGVDSP
jgi:hypothetical protein